MKTVPFVLFWLLLVFGLIVLTEHSAMMPAFLLWTVLLALFVLLASWTGGMEPAVPPVRIPSFTIDDHAAVLAPYLTVTGWKAKDAVVTFEGRLRLAPEMALPRLVEAFRSRGLTPLLLEGEQGESRVALVPAATLASAGRQPRWWLHGALLLLTFVTMTWAGALQEGIDLRHTPGLFAAGLPYSVSLLVILGAHELGHYLMARHHEMEVSPPFFVPAPFGLGTFGAFINLRGLAPDRRCTFDVAVAGPLAGLAFAVPFLWIGLNNSVVLTVPPVEGLPFAAKGVAVGSSVLFSALAKLALGTDLLHGERLLLHPFALAGWIGLLVTALNLLPIGQLDGGHIAHAMLGSRRSHQLSVGALSALFLLAFLVSPSLIAWAFVVYFLAGTRDLPARDDLTPLSFPRKLLGLLAFVLLLLILLPVPPDLPPAAVGRGFFR